jgi:mRNA-degrading endonuclease RelE of RelBE toxin-antitoxin system
VPYSIRFSGKVNGHLRHLAARQRAMVFDAIERQLTHEPAIRTRHRKRMQEGREGFVAPWELRVGDLRVYYDVEAGAEDAGVVVIQAVGIKIRNRLFIEGREIKS